jgi:hypothetical protein
MLGGISVGVILLIVDFVLSGAIDGTPLVSVKVLDDGVKGISVGTIISIVGNGLLVLKLSLEGVTLISWSDNKGSLERVDDLTIVVENVGSGSSLEGDELPGITIGVISLYVDFGLSVTVDGTPLVSVKVLDDGVKGISVGTIISIVGHGLVVLKLSSEGDTLVYMLDDEVSLEGVGDSTIMGENVGSGSLLEGDLLGGISVSIISLIIDFRLSGSVVGTPLISVKALEVDMKGVPVGTYNISVVGNGLLGLELDSEGIILISTLNDEGSLEGVSDSTFAEANVGLGSSFKGDVVK